MNVYIACGLTHVPRAAFGAYTEFIHGLARALETAGYEEVSYALKDSDPKLAYQPFEDRAKLCYRWDREMVERADIVVAEASYPSVGLGIELQLAANDGTPTILCFERQETHRAAPVQYENPDSTHHTLQIGEGFVSLMALGLPTITSIVAYGSYDEGLARIVSAASAFLESG